MHTQKHGAAALQAGAECAQHLLSLPASSAQHFHPHLTHMGEKKQAPTTALGFYVFTLNPKS